MQEENALVVVRRYCRTTTSEHSYEWYPNLIKHLEIATPDQIEAECADLTPIRLLCVRSVHPRYPYVQYPWVGTGRQHVGKFAESSIRTSSRRGASTDSSICSSADEHVRTRQADGEYFRETLYANAQRGGSFPQRV
jgi:hypothetical protein